MATTTRLGIPYPLGSDAPDGAGALFNLAKWLDDRIAPADMMVHLRWTSNSDPIAGANGQTRLYFDTVVYDPKNMRVSTSDYQAGIQTAIAGRWSLFCRAAVTSDDTAARVVLGFRNANNGQNMSARGQYGIVADNPMEHYTEEILPAGTQIQPFFYRNTTGTQYMRGAVNGVANTMQFIARYLGPS